jgi:hypothetical protein
MDPWEKRRLRLLYELRRRGDGVLELAAAALDLDPGSPIFEHLKQELVNKQEMELVAVPEGIYSDQEFYRTTLKGEQRLQEAGDAIFNDN